MPLVRRVAAAASAALLLGSFGPLTSAVAYPSEDEIERARQAEQEAGDAVAIVEGRLADLAERMDETAMSAARAAEAYNGARIALAEAEAAEEEAAVYARTTADAADRARDELGRVAAATYRAGGQFAGLEMVLQAADATEFIDSAAAFQTVTRSQGVTYDRAVEVTAEAVEAAAEAQRALRSRRDAAAAARDASGEAAAAVAVQEALLTSAERERDALLAQLAEARGTTVALEEERQAGLAAEAAAQREQAELDRAEQDRAELARSEDAGSGEDGSENDSTTGDDSDRSDVSSTSTADPPSNGSAATSSPSPTATADPSPTPPPTADPSPRPRPSPTVSAQPSSPPPAPSPPPSPSGVDRVIAYAHAQVGKPYQWGASGPDAFDCSGLTMRAWQQAGTNLPHWSVAQARATTRISYGQLRPGDLIFWSDNGQPSGTYHVALFIGNGQMIHAPRPGRPVEVQNVFYWRTPSFYGRV